MKKNKSNKQYSAPALDYIYRALSVCSTRCLFGLAKVLAFFISRTRNQISKQTRENIEICFPELTESQRTKLIRDSIHHTCCAFIELAFIWNRPINKVLAKITEIEVDESFKKSNKAKIIVVPHHGSWELLIYWLAQFGQFYTLYKPARSINLDSYILRKRTRNHAQLVPTNTTGVRSLLKGLKQKGSCMILPDQKPGKKTAAITSSFFHKEAMTSLLVKNLTSKTDCDVYIAATTRSLSTGTYQLSLKALDTNQLLQDDNASALYLNQSIENFISQKVCQYQWAYRRFTENIYQR